MVAPPSAQSIPSVDKMIDLVTEKAEAALMTPFGHLEYHRWLCARLSLTAAKAFGFTPVALNGLHRVKFGFVDPRDGIGILEIEVTVVMGKKLV
jgi:hypothetical protein